jgi:hypothetical protein
MSKVHQIGVELKFGRMKLLISDPIMKEDEEKDWKKIMKVKNLGEEKE